MIYKWLRWKVIVMSLVLSCCTEKVARGGDMNDFVIKIRTTLKISE